MEWVLNTEQILQHYDNVNTRTTLSSIGVDFTYLDNLVDTEHFREHYHYYYSEQETKRVIADWLPFFISESEHIAKYGNGMFYTLISLSNKSRLLHEQTAEQRSRTQEFIIEYDRYLKIEKFKFKEDHPWSNLMFDLKLFNIALYYGYYPEFLVRNLKSYNKLIKAISKDYEDLFTYLFQENNQPHLLTKSIICLDKDIVPLMNHLNRGRNVRELKNMKYSLTDDEEALYHLPADLWFQSKQITAQSVFFVKLVNYYPGRQDIAEFMVAEFNDWLTADFEELIEEIDYW